MSCSWNPTSWGDCIADAVQSVAGSVIDTMLGAVADGFATAATAVATFLWKQIDYATSLNLAEPGVRRLYAVALAIGVVIALALALIQIIMSVLRQDFSGIATAVKGLGLATVGVAVAIGSVAVLLTAVDELAYQVLKLTTHNSMEALGSTLVDPGVMLASNGTSLALAPIGLILFSLVLIVASVVVWVAMMIRKLLLIVAAVFAPFAFAGGPLKASAGWIRKWIEFTVALVFSKLVLVMMFAIGLAVATGAGGTGGFSNGVTNLAIGCLVLLLGGFAPWIAIKFVSFVGDSFREMGQMATQTVKSGPVGAASRQVGKLGAGVGMVTGSRMMAKGKAAMTGAGSRAAAGQGGDGDGGNPGQAPNGTTPGGGQPQSGPRASTSGGPTAPSAAAAAAAAAAGGGSGGGVPAGAAGSGAPAAPPAPMPGTGSPGGQWAGFAYTADPAARAVQEAQIGQLNAEKLAGGGPAVTAHHTQRAKASHSRAAARFHREQASLSRSGQLPPNAPNTLSAARQEAGGAR